jgi:DNA-directed RNA polymerase specialized sigma subunit
MTREQQDLVIQNQKLVYSCVKRFVNQNPQYRYLSNDLIQSGFIGLMKGVLAFKESYNTKLSTIAYKQIYWALNDKAYKNRKSFDCVPLTIKRDGEEIERPIPASGLDPEINAICKEFISQQKPTRLAKNPCIVPDCGKPRHSRGLCDMHRKRGQKVSA